MTGDPRERLETGFKLRNLWRGACWERRDFRDEVGSVPCVGW
jgi:hypothetical protein